MKFIKLTGEIKPNNTIELKWEAITDAEHDHFEVERSADGVSFTTIGTVASLPNKLIDTQPFSGINYYRIKSVSRTGQTTYSSVIHVVVKPGLWLVTVYPNPVKEELNVRVKIFGAENITMRVTDISGRVIFDRKITPDEITTDIKINSAAWSPGFYLLKLVDGHKEILATQKIIRQ